MKLLLGHSDEVINWVAWRIPLTAQRLQRDPTIQPFGPAQGIGVLNEAGTLVAGVVYHAWAPDLRSIELSCAGTSRVWARKEIVRELLRYPYEVLDCVRCTAVTPRKATSPRRFLEGLGFKREGSVRRGFLDDNAIIYGLLAEEWRSGRFGPDAT